MYQYKNLWKLCCPDPDGAAAGAAGGGEGEGGAAAKTFTQEEVDKILQGRLAKERKAFDAEKAAALKEAAENAKLSAEELAKKQREEAEAKLAQREKELLHRELKAKAAEALSTNKLSADLVDLLDLSSEEAMTASVTKLKAAFDKEVQAAVDAKLKGSTPPSGNGSPMDELAKFREAIGLPNNKK